MSIDRIQSMAGLLRVNPENSYGTTGTGSTIASLQYPGGFQIGAGVMMAEGSGICGAGTLGSSDGGGALVYPVYPKNQTASLAAQTYAASSATITHNNAPLLLMSASAGGVYRLEPPTYDGQMLTLINVANVSASLVSTIAWTGNNAGTSTAAAPVLNAAWTIGSSGVFASLGGRLCFVGLRQQGQATATSGLPIVWHRIF